MKDIDLDKLLKEAKFNFSRSGGKGGQNVNKVETKAELVFNAVDSMVLNSETKMLLLKKLKNKIDKDGNIRIYSQTERSQLGNRKKASEKFKQLIKKSLQKDPVRIKTRLPHSADINRLEKKRKTSEKKKLRREKVNAEE
jgi:ribosome-associated protein